MIGRDEYVPVHYTCLSNNMNMYRHTMHNMYRYAMHIYGYTMRNVHRYTVKSVLPINVPVHHA